MSKDSHSSKKQQSQVKNPSLRITSGIYRGQTIKSPHDSQSHPMGSREKLALFNLLQPHLTTETKLLDIYAGSGALGVEALSRGVKDATFVERNPKIAEVIAYNLQKLQIPASQFEVLAISAEKAVDVLQDIEFDIIVADPPYNDFSITSIAKISELLSNNGVLALSHPKTMKTPSFANLELLKTRTYAAAQISIYVKSTA